MSDDVQAAFEDLLADMDACGDCFIEQMSGGMNLHACPDHGEFFEEYGSDAGSEYELTVPAEYVPENVRQRERLDSE